MKNISLTFNVAEVAETHITGSSLQLVRVDLTYIVECARILSLSVHADTANSYFSGVKYSEVHPAVPH